MSGPLGPLRFQRRFLEKPWGGRALERRPGIALPAGARVGETWELVDREAENSLVAEGAPEGLALRALMEADARALLGKAPAGKGGRFPLLVKYIDAAEELSVQVHPDDLCAARLGGSAEAKTEAWYVVDAAPGAALYAGLKPGVTRADLARIGSTPEVVEALWRFEVAPGDCMVVPGGTVHAIGRGVTILEVQQNSDTTYRLWDWGRVGLDGRPRETHLEAALEAASYGAPRRPPVQAVWEDKGALARAPLARSRFFGMNALRVREEARLATGGQFQIYAVLEGRGTLRAREGGARMLSPGDVWLVPAACGYHWVAPAAGAEGLLLVQLLHRA